jgi:transcription elongation factor Elf1
MNRFICLFCYGKLHRSGKFKPASENKIELAVCDSCGEASEAIERTDTGWLCEGCME